MGSLSNKEDDIRNGKDQGADGENRIGIYPDIAFKQRGE